MQQVNDGISKLDLWCNLLVDKEESFLNKSMRKNMWEQQGRLDYIIVTQTSEKDRLRRKEASYLRRLTEHIYLPCLATEMLLILQKKHLKG